VGLWFWLITAPASLVTGFSIARLSVSLGADPVGGAGLGFIATLVVATLVQSMIDTLVAARRRD